MKSILLPAALASMMTFAPAMAQAGGQGFEIDWMVAPTSTPAAPLQVKKYEIFLTAPLLPGKLYELGGDAAANGFPAGAQWIGTRSAFPIACTYRSVSRMTVIGGQSIGYHACLVDSDKDGRFEAVFSLALPAGSMVFGAGRVPAETRPVDIAYREIAATGFTGRPAISIFSDGCLWDGNCSLTASFGDRANKAYGRLLGTVSFKSADFGQPLELAGARMVVTGKKGGRLTVEVQASIRDGRLDLSSMR